MRFHSNLHHESTSFLPWIALTVFTALWGFVPSARAQTAHFSGAVVALGSGFGHPAGVAVDGMGNVFVADFFDSTVKEIVAVNGSIPASPTINTLGSGFNQPEGVAVDGSGNVFVADSSNDAVKEILAASGYTTVNTLGSEIDGFDLPAGVAVDGSGNVFVADYGSGAVKEIPAAGGYHFNTLGSGFIVPIGVAVDGSGNVYVADTYNSAVKEILAAGGYTTINTLGSGFNDPYGVAVDGSGNVYVADTYNYAVKEILAAGGYTTVNTLGSGFNFPNGVAVDGSGNVFVGDTDNSAVKEITTAGGNFGSVNMGSSSSSPITLAFTFDTGGTLGSTAVLTQGNAALDFTDAGTGTCTAGTVYKSGATCTVDVTFKPGAPGTRYGAAELLDGSGNLLATGYVQGTGVGPQVNFLPGVQSTLGSGFDGPFGVAVDASGNIFVADTNNSAVKEILAAGGYTTINTLGSGLIAPNGLAVDGSGNVFVADYGNNVVKEILAAGGYTTVNTLGSGFNEPEGVAVDGSGNVFVADSFNNAVKEILAAGGYTAVKTLGSGFVKPFGVAVDGNGNVFVADSNNNAVKEILAAGGYTTVKTLGSGFSDPECVAVDGIGNVFVAEYGGSAVKEIVAAGGYTTINTLGSGFFYPLGVAVDGGGNVYVADWGNDRVERLDYADPPSLNFASTPVGSISSDSPQTVTVENIGDATLSTVTAYTFPADFKQVTGSGAPVDCKRFFNLLAGASCRLRIEFAPETAGTLSESLMLTDNSLNAGAPGYATQTILLSGIGAPATPSITWATPGAITYGTALSATQLNATSTVAGTFVYTPAAGTVLKAGSQTLSVAFTPTDGTDYATATKTVTLTVNKAATTTKVVSSINPSALNASVTLTATVNSPLTSATGTVTFKDGSTVLGSGTLNSSGVAAYTTTFLVAGAHSITAVYVGDGNDLGSTSAALTQTAEPAATMTSPAPGSAFGGSSVTFTWTSVSGSAGYWLFLGTTGIGSKNLYDSGEQSATSATFSSLPINGVTIYSRVYTSFNGVLVYHDYTYIAMGRPAVMMGPTPGSTLTSASATFTWTSEPGNQGYWLFLGTTGVGSKNLYDSGQQTATSATFNSLPTNGATIYARVYTKYNGTLFYNDYTYKAWMKPPVMTSPTPGSTLAGTSMTFTWTAETGSAGYWLFLGTTGVGSKNLYDSGQQSATSATVSSLPTNGVTIYARVYAKYNGVLVYNDYTYKAQ